jgi:peroxiredoxin
MKHIILISLLIILTSGYKKTKESFKESDNRIELNALRQSAPIGDVNRHTPMFTKDTSFRANVYPDVKGIPDSLSDVKVYFSSMSSVQAIYQAYKAGKIDKKYIEGYGSDTADCISGFVKTFVVIATGVSKTGQAYYLFDSDNDLDLSDELPYEAVKNSANYVDNHNEEFQPHKVIYQKVIDGKIQPDSTWIAFVENGQGMRIQRCEITTATFQFDSITYKIKVQPSIYTQYKKGATCKVLHSVSKNYDSGEYIKLGHSYYQWNCSNDGLKIILTKDTNALANGSTQIGMAPVNFTAKTCAGNTVNFPSDFKGKYVLLDFWFIGCKPCVEEIRNHYIDIYRKYGGKNFEIIGIADNLPQELDNFIKKQGINWIIIPDEQSAIQIKYNITHYPTLYLINPEGKIIAKEEELRGGKFVTILDKNIKTKQ